MNAGQRVDTPGAGGDVDGGEPAAQLEITFGGDAACLLVMTADYFQTLVTPKGVIQMHGAAAGHHEDVADSPLGYRLCNVVRDPDFRTHGKALCFQPAAVDQIAQ